MLNWVSCIGQEDRAEKDSQNRHIHRSLSHDGSWLSGLLKWNNLAGGVLGLIWTAACVFSSVNLLSKRLSLFFTGTISVIYLIFLVTYKAFRLGFHLEFHWFDSSNQIFVPGKGVFFSFPPILQLLEKEVMKSPVNTFWRHIYGSFFISFFTRLCYPFLLKRASHQATSSALCSWSLSFRKLIQLWPHLLFNFWNNQ